MTQVPVTSQNHHFLIGVGLGAVVGAALAIWLVPRAAGELRQRAVDSARDLGNRASEGYQQVTARVGEAVHQLTEHGHTVRDGMADAVVRGAHEVARQATAAKLSK